MKWAFTKKKIVAKKINLANWFFLGNDAKTLKSKPKIRTTKTQDTNRILSPKPTGNIFTKGDIIVTMDADCTYPAEVIPDLVRRLIDEDLDFITCDRLTLAEEGSMSGLHGFGNWMLSFNARLAFGYGIKDSQSGMWVFRKSIFENEKMRPTNDGMPLSEEMKILARKVLGKKKAIEISVPYRPRVGEAEIHTWGDGWKNLKFIWAKRFGLNRTRTEWGPLPDNPDSINGNVPEQS